MTQVQLNRYEQGIVESLTEDFNLEPTAAKDLVVEYIHVLRLLGGYDTCHEQAARILKAKETDYRPETWIRKIRKLRRDARFDKGWEEEAATYAQVH